MHAIVGFPDYKIPVTRLVEMNEKFKNFSGISLDIGECQKKF